VRVRGEKNSGAKKETSETKFKNVRTKFFDTKELRLPTLPLHSARKESLPLYFFLFATVLALPLRVLAFVLVRCPRTGSELMCLRPR